MTKRVVQSLTTITKRDGRIVPFDSEKILHAVERCLKETPCDPAWAHQTAMNVTWRVLEYLDGQTRVVTVEDVQDTVEQALLDLDLTSYARRYIIYRYEHAKQRDERPIPQDVRDAYAASDPYLPTPLQKFQFYDKYSRFNYDLGRRETWIETVDRAVDFLHELGGDRLPREEYEAIRQGILTQKVAPSMRLLAMAGPAARRNNASIYNCSYLPVDSVDSFVEALLISMAGCGVGYSVESRYVSQLPAVKPQRGEHYPILHVEDSAEGWAEALRHGLCSWVFGDDIRFDFSQIRPAGAVLKTKGGQASGPEPLRYLLTFARDRILARQGGRLTPLDAHDIMCAVGQASISGGVRRTALISLFDADDDLMLHSKDGDFERENAQRWNANNSAVWNGSPHPQQFLTQFTTMLANGRGEPGIVNRQAFIQQRPMRRAEADFGTNPCGEIILRPYQFCNLSSVVARADDTPITLLGKVKLATVIGTLQSMATNFPGLRPIWKQNCEEERLLGVDISGQMDCPVLHDRVVLATLRSATQIQNKHIATLLGINRSAAITCVKPSGNSSQLLDCSSGIHARWAPYYIRNVRVSAHSPVFKVLRDAGAPMDPENGQSADDATTWVVHFPVKAPDGAITRNQRSAVDQCDYWLLNKLYWTEHNPSVTITYKPEEVMELTQWVWKHRDVIGGMAFLPSSDAQYAQLPYIEITKDEYEKRASEFPEIDFSKIFRYEQEDRTTAAQELACSAGVCEL